MAKLCCCRFVRHRVSPWSTPLGIYRHPKIFLPLRSENIRTAANCPGPAVPGWARSDVSAVKAGDQSLEGPIEMDIFHNYLPHLLKSCRGKSELLMHG